MPTLFVVAGPNGCGKSTLTRTTWFSRIEVVDPDAIAPRRSSAAPLQAARQAVRRWRAAIRSGLTAAVETTLAGHDALRLMQSARTAGYRIELHYVCLISPELALDRIRNRVALGGHDVPQSDVRRRFVRSLADLPAAIERSDETRLYDNSDPSRPHREVAVLSFGRLWTAEHLPDWAAAGIAGTASQCR